MFNPIATYRIQFHSEFTFSDFERIIPYLHQLGIKTIYASPIFEAVPGSMHGYDAVKPDNINPELGTLEQLRKIAAQLKEWGMSWIQDIVPNHMGFHHHNAWLMDVLKNGDNSAYRNYFDILPDNLTEEPLMAPFLGDDLETIISADELEIVVVNEENFIKYHDSLWPINEGTDVTLSIAEILDQQFYRLCNYKESHKRMNYRRFFTVNNLICLNIQDPIVFEDYHKFTKLLLDEGIIQGLRIDHVDGLFDPTAYVFQLRELCGEQTYIIVEKILEPAELLPSNWPIQGTTGYDFLGLVNQLFTNEKAEKKFNKFYKDLGRFNSPVANQIRSKKREFLTTYMQGELDNLFQGFLKLWKESLNTLGTVKQSKELQPEIFKEIIIAFLVHCPVYRFYSAKLPLKGNEQEVFEAFFDSISEEPEFCAAQKIFKHLIFQNEGEFFLRLMQFTGPLMAKGVEDTLMYTFNRFIGNNEVGDSPEVFGITAEEFHQRIAERHHNWPMAMNASATHDTKRGEDARARLNVLTDLKDGWPKEAAYWKELNEDLKKNSQPDNNDEYFIYQTLLATYPEQDSDQEDYLDRLLAYVEKALRESKARSNWEEPDQQYEANCKTFIIGLLNKKRPFWKVFISFYQMIASFGKINSLSALILKHACPGIPDTYQGTELWDLSMVDPDNRRPIDYDVRKNFLEEIGTEIAELPELWRTAPMGKIKLFFLQQMLKLKGEYPDVFDQGQYLPLSVKGKYSDHVLAFARHYQNTWLVFIMPIQLSSILNSDPAKIENIDWEDTYLELPKAIGEEYNDLLRHKSGTTTKELSLKKLLKDLPYAILHFKKEDRKRAAGVLMPISSLPATYGIGDFGPAAKTFLDFLAESGQKYWQVLPMNPLSKSQSYSPYSATSVIAGNVLFISPDVLYDQGLLSQNDLKEHNKKTKRKVNFEKIEDLKIYLLDIAFKNFKVSEVHQDLEKEFDIFCKNEAYWLDDYALYEILKVANDGQPWLDWIPEHKTREATALTAAVQQYAADLELIKWKQFIFDKQWKAIRKYASVLNIKLIGDLPFYAALDSADVWANPQLFNIDAEGNVLGIAGVPPDYFNEDGQLWGMPVYNWEKMKSEQYKWWIRRIEKNIELYHLIRLDHFRAFAAYWEVPAGADSAKTGSWKPGPAEDFFKVLLHHFGELPIIAEDLGEITPDVFALRDQFNLPGMKVMQFAFGEDMADSIHSPHNMTSDNCIAYTGTHDNNTTLGWYEEEADSSTKLRLEQYTDKKLNKRNAVETLIRLAYASVAKIVIIPVQDLLNKDSKARMNTPASVDGNWIWRLKSDDLKQTIQGKLLTFTKLYGR
jgi:malto-oligosyltrehalose synthase/4-alpha-glucanotransferase